LAIGAFVLAVLALCVRVVSAYPAWRLWRIDRAKKKGRSVLGAGFRQMLRSKNAIALAREIRRVTLGTDTT
jgi:hypothetical protein